RWRADRAGSYESGERCARSPEYRRAVIADTTASPAITRDESRALFGQTMGLVALTTAFFALGAYLGRDMAYQWGWLWFIASFVCLLGLSAAVQRSEQLAIGMLLTFGLLIGLGTAPSIAYYVS